LNNTISKKEKKTLFENITSLAVVQITGYILPLITFPYLVRVLGPEYLGAIAFATAIITYFTILTDYGFELSATRQVSLNRNIASRLNEIFSAVITLKITIMFFSFILLNILVFSITKLEEFRALYFFTFGLVVSQSISSVWFYQGIEKIKYVAFINLFFRALYVVLIFVFIKSQSDYLKVSIFLSATSIFAEITSLIFLKWYFKIEFKAPKFKEIKYQLVQGKDIFFSKISITFYTNSLTFILGLLTNYASVGVFSAAHRIIQAINGLMSTVSRSLYPLIGKKLNDDRKTGLLFIKKTSTFVIGVAFMASMTLFLFSEPIVNILLGSQFHNSIPVLKVMSFLPLVIAISNMSIIQTMLNLNLQKQANWIFFLAAILAIISSFIFITYAQELGAAYSMLLVEVFVSVASIIYLCYYFQDKSP